MTMCCTTNTHDCLLQLLGVLMLKATSTSLADLNPGTLKATGTISDPNILLMTADQTAPIAS